MEVMSPGPDPRRLVPRGGHSLFLLSILSWGCDKSCPKKQLLILRHLGEGYLIAVRCPAWVTGSVVARQALRPPNDLPSCRTSLRTTGLRPSRHPPFYLAFHHCSDPRADSHTVPLSDGLRLCDGLWPEADRNMPRKGTLRNLIDPASRLAIVGVLIMLKGFLVTHPHSTHLCSLRQAR